MAGSPGQVYELAALRHAHSELIEVREILTVIPFATGNDVLKQTQDCINVVKLRILYHLGQMRAESRVERLAFALHESYCDESRCPEENYPGCRFAYRYRDKAKDLLKVMDR